METKPKCYLCKQVGTDKFYYWHADIRGKGGRLCHESCVIEVMKTINLAKKNGDQTTK